MAGGDDPGWWPAVRKAAPYVLVPLLPLFLQALGKKRTLEVIVELRVHFLHFAWSLVFVLWALLPIVAGEESASVWVPLALVGYWVLSVGAFLWARSRPLVPLSPETLAASYRSVFFLEVTFAVAPALMGFTGSMIADALWPYLIGAGISAIGLGLAAPTKADIARRQRQVSASGSPHSLIEALRRPPPSREEQRRVTDEVRDHLRGRATH